MTAQLWRGPWVIHRNSPFPFAFQYVDENGEGLSLVGHTVTAFIRSGRSYDSTLVKALTVTFTDAAEGEGLASLTQAETALLTAAIIANPMSWGQVWVTGPSTGNAPLLIVEANPVEVI